MSQPVIERVIQALVVVAAVYGGWSVGWRATAEEEPASPFAPSALRTATGGLADPDWYYEPDVCGECHTTQFTDWKGSLHSQAHKDTLYLAFAELARKEGGDDLYRFCSACHAPGAVATGEIPGDEDTERTFLTDDGVSCDICHSVSRVTTRHAGGGANASIVLEEGEIRFGPLKDPADTSAHESAYSETHQQSRFCSACHTLTHPTNGVVIENTFAEWQASPYAAAGIQCQDCHMRTAEQAAQVARNMKPLVVPGESVEGVLRPNTFAHLFVGGNVNAALTGSSARHAAEAKARLRSAATLALELPEDGAGGREVSLTVAVTNVGAGHSIPTSITELRQVWLDVTVRDAAGAVVYRSGELTADGALPGDAVVYTSTLHDAEGNVTYLPWRAAKLAKENLLHAKETRREVFTLALPEDAAAPFAVRAVLRYRSAPQDVLDTLFGKGKLVVVNVDMAEAEGTFGDQ